MPIFEPYRPWPYAWHSLGTAEAKWPQVMKVEACYPFAYRGFTSFNLPGPPAVVNRWFAATWNRSINFTNEYLIDPKPAGFFVQSRLIQLMRFENGDPISYEWNLVHTQTAQTDYPNEVTNIPWDKTTGDHPGAQADRLIFPMFNQQFPFDRRFLEFHTFRRCTEWPPP